MLDGHHHMMLAEITLNTVYCDRSHKVAVCAIYALQLASFHNSSSNSMAPRASGERRSAQFVQRNLALLGFGSHERALVQTVKELFENGAIVHECTEATCTLASLMPRSLDLHDGSARCNVLERAKRTVGGCSAASLAH